jgi:hypothetical protein
MSDDKWEWFSSTIDDGHFATRVRFRFRDISLIRVIRMGTGHWTKKRIELTYNSLDALTKCGTWTVFKVWHPPPWRSVTDDIIPGQKEGSS